MSTRLPLPNWLKKRLPKGRYSAELSVFLRSLNLNTVCQSALCPNIGECFSRGTATFMILGNICTRNCRFCGVSKGKPFPLDSKEPKRIAEAAKMLQLSHVVVTSVARDDLPDGGASQFARAIEGIRKELPEVIVEVLIPDFQGNIEALKQLVSAKPDIINHNVETVPRLYPEVRPQADYQRSIRVLEKVKHLSSGIYTKSGLMVGLGEREEEVIRVMQDLREIACDFFTIGQYLRPSPEHLEVKEYIPPKTFDKLKEIAVRLGFSSVAAGPFVRSSYQAKELFVGRRGI